MSDNKILSVAKFQQHFAEKAEKQENKFVRNTKSSIKSARGKLAQAMRNCEDKSSQAFAKLSEYYDTLTSLYEQINNIGNSISSIRDGMLQVNNLEQIVQILNQMGQYNVDLSDILKKGLFDATTISTLQQTILPILSIDDYNNLATSLQYSLGQFDIQGLNSEIATRHNLAQFVGDDMAFTMNLPSMRYNPSGSINNKNELNQLTDVVNFCKPLIEKGQTFVNQGSALLQQVSEQIVFKNKTEQEIVKQVETHMREIMEGNTTSSERQYMIRGEMMTYREILQKYSDKIADIAKGIRNPELGDEKEQQIQAKLLEYFIELDNKIVLVDEILKNTKDNLSDTYDLLANKGNELLHNFETLGTDAVSDIVGILKVANEMYAEDLTPSHYEYKLNNLGLSNSASAKLFKTYNRFRAINPNIENIATSLTNKQLLNQMNEVHRLNTLSSGYVGDMLTLTKGLQNPDISDQFKLYSRGFVANGQAQIDLLKSVSDSPFVTKEEQAIQKGIIEAAKEALSNIDKFLILFDKVDKNSPEYKELVKERTQLKATIASIENMKTPLEHLSSAFKTLWWAKNGLWNVFKGGLGFLGIGAILSPLQMFRKTLGDDINLGKLRYDVTMTDATIGLTANGAVLDQMTYSVPRTYFDMTYGMIDFPAISKLYHGMLKTIGGHYGESSRSARNDMAYFAKQTMVDKELFSLGDGDIQSFLKTFYKDMGNSVTEAVGKLRALEGKAISANVPMEKLLGTINGMTEGLRNLGVESEVVLNSVTALTGWNGMRIEEATELVQNTANAASNMSSNWSRNLFWGVMSKPSITGDPFDIILEGYKTHNADGSVNDAYIDNMVDRLFAESSFFDDRWSNDENLGSLDMLTHIMDQGYTMKQASMIVRLKKEGKIDELKNKLKGYEKLKDPLAPATTAKELSDQLHTAAEQLSEVTKIQSNISRVVRDMAYNLDKVFGPLLQKGREFMDNLIHKYEQAMVNIIGSIGAFFNSPLGGFLTHSFKESPFLTIGGMVLTGVLAKRGMRNLGKRMWNGVRGKGSGLSKTEKYIYGGLATTGLVASGMNMELGQIEQARQFQDDVADQAKQNNEPLDYGTALVNMFKDGNALICFVLGDAEARHKRGLIANTASILIASGFGYLAYRFWNKFSNPRDVNLLIKGKFISKELKKQMAEIEKKKKSLKYAIRREYKKYRKQRNRKRAENRRIYRQRVHEMVLKYREYERKLKRLNKQRRSIIRKRYNQMYGKRGSLLKGGGFWGNLVWSGLGELLYGNPNSSIGARAAGVGAETFLMTMLSKKFGFAGTLASMVVAPTVGSLVSDTVNGSTASAMSLYDQALGQQQASKNGADSQEQSNQYKRYCDTQRFKTNSYKKEKEMAMQTDTIADVARALGMSHEQFVAEIKASFENHGMNWAKTGAHEKQIWADSFTHFMELYKDVGKALTMAAQALASANAQGGGAGSPNVQFSSDAVNDWQKADPEGYKMALEYAKKYNVPIGLVAAIARTESNFNQSAGSGAGAIGVMQLMPDTAAGLGVNPYDKAQNIEGGIKLLRQNLDYYKGDKIKAVAAYNAGAGNVDDWVQKYGSEWYNHIPFEETYNYVRKVGVVSGNKPAQSNGSSNNGGVNVNVSSVALDAGIHRSGNVNLNGAKADTIAMINYAHQMYKKMFGRDDFWLSAVVNGHDANSAHGQGYKADVGGSALEESAENRQKFQAVLQAAGIGANNEYDDPSSGSTGGHFDLDVRGYNWQQNKNYGGFGKGSGSPVFNTEALKPKTIKEQHEAGWKSYYDGIGAKGKTIKGAMVNGMYIDKNKSFVSIEESKKQLRKKRDQENKSALEQIKRATASTENDKKAKDDYLAQQTKQIISHEEIELMLDAKRRKGRQIAKLIEGVKELAKEFYESDVKILSDI